MDTILSWPPVLWLGRIIAIAGLAGLLGLVVLLLVRLGRPATWKAVSFGALPRMKLRIMGQEIELAEQMDTQRDQQLEALNRQIKTVAVVLRKYGEHLSAHREALEVLLDMEDDDAEDTPLGDQERDPEGDPPA